jgi:hypothetical protein
MLKKLDQTLAYRLAPCIIVIDEMDSLFGARKGKEDRPWYRNIVRPDCSCWIHKFNRVLDAAQRVLAGEYGAENLSYHANLTRSPWTVFNLLKRTKMLALSSLAQRTG